MDSLHGRFESELDYFRQVLDFLHDHRWIFGAPNTHILVDGLCQRHLPQPWTAFVRYDNWNGLQEVAAAPGRVTIRAVLPSRRLSVHVDRPDLLFPVPVDVARGSGPLRNALPRLFPENGRGLASGRHGRCLLPQVDQSQTEKDPRSRPLLRLCRPPLPRQARAPHRRHRRRTGNHSRIEC